MNRLHTARTAGRTGQTPDIDIGIGSIAEVLSNPRRRGVIEMLSDASEIPLGDLAYRLAKREKDGEPTSQERKRLYIALHQTHLPKMDDEDVIEYRENRKLVSRGPNYAGVQWALGTIQSYLT